MQRQVFSGVQSYINDVLRSSGASNLPCFITDAVVSLPDAYFQLGVPALEYPRALPSGIRFIGTLPVPAQIFEPPVWWGDVEQARAAGRSILLVTQGTIASADLGQLVIPTLRAFARADVLVIAITSGADPRPVAVTAPPNSRIARFIPYEAVLPQVDLLITNGGFGGVLRALTHGVPLLVAGDSEEKPEIAARIAHAGVGINLATGQPDTTLIAAAASEILGSRAYRTRAGAVARELADIDAVGTIEAVLAAECAQALATA
jgi:UDP:flavonoid glycosyltransferase YjiC (YdhE family)